MSDPPQFDWLKIPGVEAPLSSTGSLNTMFDQLHITKNDKAFFSDDNLAVSHQPNDLDALLGGRVTRERSRSRDSSPREDTASVPLSLTANQLTHKEAKAYLRWYDYIQSRKEAGGGSRTVSVDDVFRFLGNFGIGDDLKRQLRVMFARWDHSLNIGQFFALMRLIAHGLNGETLTRDKIRAPIATPRPRSIMRKNNIAEEGEGEEDGDQSDASSAASAASMDLDSFTQFILTGERPASRKKRKSAKSGAAKKVKFSDEVVWEPAPQYERRQEAAVVAEQGSQQGLDFQLPMEELLKQMGNTGGSFSGVNVESLSVGGVPTTVPSVAIDAGDGSAPVVMPEPDIQPLSPNLTGSVSKSLRKRIGGTLSSGMESGVSNGVSSGVQGGLSNGVQNGVQNGPQNGLQNNLQNNLQNTNQSSIPQNYFTQNPMPPAPANIANPSYSTSAFESAYPDISAATYPPAPSINVTGSYPQNNNNSNPVYQNSSSSEILPGSQRANLFLESALTGGTFGAPAPSAYGSAPPPPPSRNSMRPPAPPPRGSSPMINPNLLTPQLPPRYGASPPPPPPRANSPSLPPKPQLSPSQQQRFVTSVTPQYMPQYGQYYTNNGQWRA